MGDFRMRKTYFPTGSSGNFRAAAAQDINLTIKKTCGKRQRFERTASVRWRDESVAVPDTGRASRQPRRARTRERGVRLHT